MERKERSSSLLKEAKQQKNLEGFKVMELDISGFPCFGCVCGQIHYERYGMFWIQCDACDSWHHVSSDCLGINEREASQKLFECQSCTTLEYSEKGEKKLSFLERSGGVSSYFVDNEMNQELNNIKLDFGKKCLARRMERTKGYWEPVIQLGPYDIPPGEVREEWLVTFQKVCKNN